MKHITQKERVLRILLANESVTNFELHAIFPPIYQIPARIWELKNNDGYNIESRQDSDDRRKWHYSLIPVAKQTEQV